MALVSASILACDQTRIGEQIIKAEAAGIDYTSTSWTACMWRT